MIRIFIIPSWNNQHIDYSSNVLFTFLILKIRHLMILKIILRLHYPIHYKFDI